MTNDTNEEPKGKMRFAKESVEFSATTAGTEPQTPTPKKVANNS